MRQLINGIVFVALLAGGYWYYEKTWLPEQVAKKQAAAAAVKKGPPPAPVITAVVTTKSVPIRLEGVGTVQPRSTVAIKSRVDGQIFEAAVKEGRSVKKGDLLFRLDPRPFEAALKQAQANVERDRANLDKARTDLLRYRDLAVKGISPLVKQDDAQAQANALAATLVASEAAVEVARLNLEYATIRSPIDGRVGNILVHPGNMVKANDTQALIMITEVKPIYVGFALPEQHLSEIKRRMAADRIKVEVTVPEDSGPQLMGELFFLNNQVDTSTGTIALMATFDNADERLTAGQFVRARVTLAVLEDAVVVATQSVQHNQKGSYVYVVKPDRTAEMRFVSLGPVVDDVTVIAKGLARGEVIITDGQLRVIPGGPVAPKGAAEPGAQQAKSKTQS